MKRIQKCQFGYIKYKRIGQLIKAIIWMAVILILFFTGILLNGSKNNIFTIFASISALPFAKTAANFILFLPYKPADYELYNQLEEHKKQYLSNYDCIFTTKEKVIPVQAAITTEHSIYAYTESKKVDTVYFEKSLSEFMKKANYEINVHLFHDENQFMKKIDLITKQNNRTDCTDLDSKNEKMRRVNDSMKVMCL